MTENEGGEETGVAGRTLRVSERVLLAGGLVVLHRIIFWGVFWLGRISFWNSGLSGRLFEGRRLND